MTGGAAPSPPTGGSPKGGGESFCLSAPQNVHEWIPKGALRTCKQVPCALPGAAPLLAIRDGLPPRFALPPVGGKDRGEKISPGASVVTTKCRSKRRGQGRAKPATQWIALPG